MKTFIIAIISIFFYGCGASDQLKNSAAKDTTPTPTTQTTTLLISLLS